MSAPDRKYDFQTGPDPDLETVAACELCAGRVFVPFRVCREPDGPEIIPPMRGSRVFQIVRCAGCGLVFVNPRYNREKLKRIYGPAYFRGEPNTPSAVARARYWSSENCFRRLAADVRFLRRFVPPGAVLDAGCGLGLLADALGSTWRVTGVEWDAAAAAGASRASQCAPLPAADLEEVDLEPGRFDGLVMTQVLDHLRRPLKVLRRLAPAVKPGGFVYLSGIINIESPVSKFFQNEFRLLAPNHLY